MQSGAGLPPRQQKRSRALAKMTAGAANRVRNRGHSMGWSCQNLPGKMGLVRLRDDRRDTLRECMALLLLPDLIDLAPEPIPARSQPALPVWPSI
jgi:hypothetical protein